MITLAIIWLVSALILAIYVYIYEEEVILKEAIVCFGLAPLALCLITIDSFKSLDRVINTNKKEK